MFKITLPDGNNLDFAKKVTGLEVAEKIIVLAKLDLKILTG